MPDRPSYTFPKPTLGGAVTVMQAGERYIEARGELARLCIQVQTPNGPRPLTVEEAEEVPDAVLLEAIRTYRAYLRNPEDILN